MKRSTMRLFCDLRDEMEDDLGIGCRLADGAVGDEVAPERQPVGQVAVVADRQAAGREFGEQGLDVAQDGFAGRRIADVADRHPALQPADRLLFREVVADQTETTLGMEARAVEAHDAGRFLAAMLKRMEPERRQGRGILMADDAENPALLAQPVVRVRCLLEHVVRHHCPVVLWPPNTGCCSLSAGASGTLSGGSSAAAPPLPPWVLSMS